MKKRRKPRKTEPGVLFCPAPSPASLAHKSGVAEINSTKEDERLESAQRERSGEREKKKYGYLSLLNACFSSTSDSYFPQKQVKGPYNYAEKKIRTYVCTHITSKQIELEGPGWSGLVRF